MKKIIIVLIVFLTACSTSKEAEPISIPLTRAMSLVSEVDTINEASSPNLISENSLQKIAQNSSFTRSFNSDTKRVGAPIWAQKESVKAVLTAAKDLDIGH